MEQIDTTLFQESTTPPLVRRRKKVKSQQVFKPSYQHQVMLMPPSLEDMIPQKHLVRVVNSTIDALNLDPLLATYKGGGTSSYHPRILLKILVYAYLMKVYSSRRIAKAVREHVPFMWLAGMSTPNFRTLNGFRSGRLKGVIEQVFGSMVIYLGEKNYINLEEYFTDGSKFQADNNKHKVVWAKNTQRYKERIQEKIAERLQEIEKVNEAEQRQYGERDLEELGEQSTVSLESVSEEVDRLNVILQENLTPRTGKRNTSTHSKQKGLTSAVVSKQVAKVQASFSEETPSKPILRAIKDLEKNLLPKLQKYEHQEETLRGRNSYAKTDTDATAFRMKDGQLLPAYNVMIGTQNQFILNYSIHQQRASESDALIAHCQRFHRIMGRYPGAMMGDSAFGTEENYRFLEDHHIGNYLKFNTFHFEQTKKFRTDPYRKEHFPYDSRTDTYQCPAGKHMVFKEDIEGKTATGYQTQARRYECEDCRGCPLAKACKHGEGNRTIQINPTLERYRQQARENLNSAKGIALRKQRGCDVEPVFGDIKFNQGYTRCRLRGEQKVDVELGLLCMTHNVKKIGYTSN